MTKQSYNNQDRNPRPNKFNKLSQAILSERQNPNSIGTSNTVIIMDITRDHRSIWNVGIVVKTDIQRKYRCTNNQAREQSNWLQNIPIRNTIIDSGAPHHLAGELSIFDDVEQINPAEFKFADAMKTGKLKIFNGNSDKITHSLFTSFLG